MQQPLSRPYNGCLKGYFILSVRMLMITIGCYYQG